MKKLVMMPDTTAPWLWVYDEKGEFYDAGLSETETKAFQSLLDSVESRYTCEALCGEYYETLGFETQEEKDELIADAFKLFGEVKRNLSDRYEIDDYPDLTELINTPAGRREELRKAYAKEHHLG
jgi:hypothetical protein